MGITATFLLRLLLLLLLLITIRIIINISIAIITITVIILPGDTSFPRDLKITIKFYCLGGQTSFWRSKKVSLNPPGCISGYRLKDIENLVSIQSPEIWFKISASLAPL